MIYLFTRPPGPVCSVCTAGYGRGAENQSHKCTAYFMGRMFFVLSVAVPFALGMVCLLSGYLVRVCCMACANAIPGQMRNCFGAETAFDIFLMVCGSMLMKVLHFLWLGSTPPTLQRRSCYI